VLHVYYGDGKGKTTAAMGLALRAHGAGLSPAVVQFLKDGTSGEVRALRDGLGVPVLANTPPVRFSFQMDAAEKAAVRRENDANLGGALARLEAGACDVLVLDEAADALALGLLDEDLLRRAVELAAGNVARELAVTGHDVPTWLKDRADYLTRMACERHPYAGGLSARRGVEY
jgi:cob(I)alamin adenosyltransferase